MNGFWSEGTLQTLHGQIFCRQNKKKKKNYQTKVSKLPRKNFNEFEKLLLLKIQNFCLKKCFVESCCCRF
jgi:hypothetical protein